MQLFRGVTVHADVKVTDESYRDFTVMGEDYLVLDFYSPDEIIFQKNDYCFAFGERFSIVEKPVPTLVKGVYHYNFKLYNTYKELEKVKVFLFDAARDLTQADFPYTCTPSDLVQLIVDNLNAVQDHVWTVGSVIAGDAKTITISNQNCLELLTAAASEWETEWYVEGFEVSLRERSAEADPVKELALGTGLQHIEQEDNQRKAITRLYVFGGTRNLPSGYGSERLKMPVAYLDSGDTDVQEDLKTFDDIYPRRIGLITAVRQNASGIFFFKDSGIDFDPNALQVDGLSKHIIFQSGSLVGYDFEVNWNETTQEFEIIRLTESSGIELPSADLAPGIGDTYIIYNIEMPASYVTAAEVELQAAAQSWFDQHTTDRLSFNVSLDEVYFTANDLALQPGEVVALKHNLIDVLKNGLNIRVTGFKRYINIPHRYEAVKVSDTVYVNPVSSVQGQVNDLEKVIERNGLNRQGYTARNWRDVAELSAMIDTLQTKLLIVGDEQGQFRLNNVIFTANYEGNTNAFNATAGSLVHTTVPDFENPGSWNIQAFATALASDSTPYYLYAKCSRTNNAGEFVFDANFIAYDSDSMHWYFLIGVISSKTGDWRSFQTVYGFSTISGNQITTGLIKSTDGKTSFNLDTGEIRGRIIFTSDGVTYKNVADMDAGDVGADPAGSASAAQAAAEAYALAKADLAETTAKAYADGIVSDEEARAIADAQAKADAAEAAAIATAATDATTKANAAQSNAISTASTDATTKANNAQSAAETYADGLVNTLSGSLGDMAYQDLVNIAKLDSTIIQGGYIKTTLLDVSAIKVTGGLASQMEAQGYANDAQSAAISAASTDATTKANNAQSAAETYADGLYDSLNLAKQDAIVNGQTLIVGGYLNTDFIEAGSIVADKIVFDGASGNNVNLSGTINAASGTIGGFSISSSGIVNDTGLAYVICRNTSEGRDARIGSSVFPLAGSGVTYFKNEYYNPYATNYAVYARARNTGSQYPGDKGYYAGYFDGHVEVTNGDMNVSGLVRGRLALPLSTRKNNMPDVNNYYLSSNYNIFIGDLKTTNRNYYLPSAASYQAGEMIYFSNWNDHDAYLHALSGQTINGYTDAQKYISLTSAVHSCVLMSNGSNQWIIVSCYGTF